MRWLTFIVFQISTFINNKTVQTGILQCVYDDRDDPVVLTFVTAVCESADMS